MNDIIVNTTSLQDYVDDLQNVAKYYSSKKSTFSSGSYGSNTCGTLASYLKNVQKIYEDIALNIENINEYLRNYYMDVNTIETQFTGGRGSFRVSEVIGLVNKYKNSLVEFKIDASNLFVINNYTGSQVRNSGFEESNSEPNYDDVNPLKRAIGTFNLGGLAMLEGILNIAEGIGDGLMLIGSTIQSLLGNEEKAQEIGETISKDWSKDIYNWAVSTSGIDQYANPNGFYAQYQAIGGNVAGNLLMGLGTAGTGSALFGVGSKGASVFTTVAGGATGALTNAGSEAEIAIQEGATTEEARLMGLVGAGAGMITGSVSGYIDDAARAIGAIEGSIGKGIINKFSISSLVVNGTEPVINTIARTGIYKNDGKRGFWNNFLNNAEEDGLLFEMALAGGTGAAGTIINGYAGKLNLDNLREEIDEVNRAVRNGETSVIKLISATEMSSTLLDKIEDVSKVKFEVNGRLYSVDELKSSRTQSIGGIKDKVASLEVEQHRVTASLGDVYTEDLPVIRDLTNQEIQVKIKEYNDILEKYPMLKNVLDNENNANTIAVYENLYGVYEKLKTLRAEVDAGMGVVTPREAILVKSLDENFNPFQDYAERLVKASTDAKEFSKYCEEILSYTNLDLPVGFSSLAEYKLFIVNKLRTDNIIDNLNDTQLYYLFKDDDIFSMLIGDQRLDKYFIDNLEENTSVLAQNVKVLSLNDIEKLFNSQRMKNYLERMSDNSFNKIFSTFKAEGINLFIASPTFRDRFINMPNDYLNDYFKRNGENLNYLMYTTSDSLLKTKYLDFAHELLKRVEKDGIYSNANLINRLATIIPDNINEYGSVNRMLKQYDVEIQKLLAEKILDNSSNSILRDIIHFYPNNTNVEGLKANMSNAYYDVKYILNGVQIDESINISGKYGLMDFVYDKSLISQVLNDEIQFVAVTKNDAKTILNFGNNGLTQYGLNEISLVVDGKSITIVKNINHNTDLNGMFSNAKNVQFISSRLYPSYDITDVDPDAIYLLKYKIDGQSFEQYMLPTESKLNINQYIEYNNLVGINNVEVVKVDMTDSEIISKLDIFQKIRGSESIFTDQKYGGNQGDVSDLVQQYLSLSLIDRMKSKFNINLNSSAMSKIERDKASLLINIIKKYYPNANTTNVKNIAYLYAKGGCGYMSTANAFVTYMNSIEDGANVFKNKMGYDLYFKDGDQMSYNLEAVALENYLFWSKNINNFSIKDLYDENNSGILMIKMGEVVGSFFNSKGIANSSKTIKFEDGTNLNNELLAAIFINNPQFITIGAQNFGLRRLTSNVDIDSEDFVDGSLQSASVQQDLRLNIGGHAMLLTEFDSTNNDLIVSSWSDKYSFIPPRINDPNVISEKKPWLYLYMFDFNVN